MLRTPTLMMGLTLEAPPLLGVFLLTYIRPKAAPLGTEKVKDKHPHKVYPVSRR
jgi:hypothetical protein